MLLDLRRNHHTRFQERKNRGPLNGHSRVRSVLGARSHVLASYTTNYRHEHFFRPHTHHYARDHHPYHHAFQPVSRDRSQQKGSNEASNRIPRSTFSVLPVDYSGRLWFLHDCVVSPGLSIWPDDVCRHSAFRFSGHRPCVIIRYERRARRARFW